MAKSAEGVEATPRDEMHVDDFLNHIESVTKQIELVAAYAFSKRAKNEVKKTLNEWQADFEAFKTAIPK